MYVNKGVVTPTIIAMNIIKFFAYPRDNLNHFSLVPKHFSLVRTSGQVLNSNPASKQYIYKQTRLEKKSPNVCNATKQCTFINNFIAVSLLCMVSTIKTFHIITMYINSRWILLGSLIIGLNIKRNYLYHGL